MNDGLTFVMVIILLAIISILICIRRQQKINEKLDFNADKNISDEQDIEIPSDKPNNSFLNKEYKSDEHLMYLKGIYALLWFIVLYIIAKIIICIFVFMNISDLLKELNEVFSMSLFKYFK